ncbi:unnamed protein product [Discula destructiva]
MGGPQEPYMYTPTNHDNFDSYCPPSPSKPFDPKAVTRASWEPKPPKPKHEGPLVSFNRHPDTHVVPEPRKQYKLPGPRTKAWIKGLRIAGLCLRVLQLIAAAGILFLFIIIDNVSSLTAWILRITAGVTMLHCAYGVFHLARPAGDRPPASSAAYQTFAAFTDLAVLPLYAYGCLSVRNSSGHWGTLLQNESLMNYFLPSLFYTLFVGVIIHLISMVMGLWLALKFRQIANLPPDMNPLEDKFTSRHKKKLSVATTSTYNFEAVPFEQLRRSGMPYDSVDTERPPSVPFHATRSSPRSSFGSADLPHRQYQIEPGNSPRNSITAADLKRMSAPVLAPPSGDAPTPTPRSPWRNSQAAYSEVSTTNSDLAEFLPPYGRSSIHTPPSPRSHRAHQSRPSTASPTRGQPSPTHANAPPSSSQARPAKFTEAWQATESLFNRTHAKNRATMPEGTAAGAYAAIRRRYDLSDSDDSDSDYETETATALSVAGYSVLSPPATEVDDDAGDLGASPSPHRRHHPNPLRSNPSLPSIAGSAGSPTTRKQGRLLATSTPLSEIDLNDGRVGSGLNNNITIATNGGADITDERAAAAAAAAAPRYGGLGLSEKSGMMLRGASSKRHTWAPRDRNSSIQPEADFYAKPYGELRASTPPIVAGGDRQVSSGNDYTVSGMGGGQAAKRYFSFGRRNVSGKLVEEGRAVGYAH